MSYQCAVSIAHSPYISGQSTVGIMTIASSSKGSESNERNSYDIHDIDEYRGYQSLLLSYYALEHNYHIKLYNEQNSVNHCVSDPRWNKIYQLYSVMSSDWKEVRSVLWMDSDAVILNMKFDVEVMMGRYPQAHLLVSSDVKQGLMNSGVMLLRNTAFMRGFLLQWWGTPRDRELHCDQNRFDQLYGRYMRVDQYIQQYLSLASVLPASLYQVISTIHQHQQHVNNNADLWKHYDMNDLLELAEYYTLLLQAYNNSQYTAFTSIITILPMRALNSHPPAMIYQQPGDEFLHLMGEFGAYRSAVFQRAWAHVCEVGAGKGISLDTQLTVTQPALIAISLSTYGNITHLLIRQLTALIQLDIANSLDDTTRTLEKSSDALTEVLGLMDKLQKAAHHLCDIYDYHAYLLGAPGDDVGEYQLLQWNLRKQIFALVGSYSSTVDKNRQIFLQQGGNSSAYHTSYLYLLKYICEAGNDLYSSSHNIDEKLLVAEFVQSTLYLLMSQVHASALHIPYHMHALMTQQVMLLHYTQAYQLLAEHASNDLVSRSYSQSIEYCVLSLKGFQHDCLLNISVRTGVYYDSGRSISTVHEYINSYILVTVLHTNIYYIEQHLHEIYNSTVHQASVLEAYVDNQWDHSLEHVHVLLSPNWDMAVGNHAASEREDMSAYCAGVSAMHTHSIHVLMLLYHYASFSYYNLYHYMLQHHAGGNLRRVLTKAEEFALISLHYHHCLQYRHDAGYVIAPLHSFPTTGSSGYVQMITIPSFFQSLGHAELADVYISVLQLVEQLGHSAPESDPAHDPLTRRGQEPAIAHEQTPNTPLPPTDSGDSGGDEEWEECVEGEDGCEPYYIQPPITSTPSPPHGGHVYNDDDEEEVVVMELLGHVLHADRAADTVDEDDENELLEIRARYLAQSQRRFQSLPD